MAWRQTSLGDAPMTNPSTRDEPLSVAFLEVPSLRVTIKTWHALAFVREENGNLLGVITSVVLARLQPRSRVEAIRCGWWPGTSTCSSAWATRHHPRLGGACQSSFAHLWTDADVSELVAVL